MRPSNWIRALGVAFVLVAVAISVPLYFARIEHYASIGNDVGAGALRAAFVITIVALTALPVVLFALVRSSVRRERLLATLYPQGVTFELMFWKSVFQSMPAEPLGVQDEVAKYGVKVTVVASDSGIAFWTGRGEPKRVAELHWSDVRDVRTGGGSANFTTHRPSLIIETKRAGAVVGAVRRERGWSVLQEPELEELAKSLRGIGELSNRAAT